MSKVSVIIPVWNQESLVERAIRSVPKRNDVEIIVIDDGSTDDTPIVLRTILEEELGNFNFICLFNEENRGVGYTVNKGYDYASGEYLVNLGSDDYFYTENFEKAMEELDGTDLVYFDLKVNDGTVYKLNDSNKQFYCGSTKFMRRAFVGDTRCPEIRAGEDRYFYDELMKKNPTEKFTNIVVKHYNFPRKGSLMDLSIKGILKA